jgi:hypothetical protein
MRRFLVAVLVTLIVISFVCCAYVWLAPVDAP